MPGGVPDTDTFSMQDVVNEIGAGDDLVELFSLATGTFDPAYVGDKTNLLNFRNYSHILPVNLVETWGPSPGGDLGWTPTGTPVIGGGSCIFNTLDDYVDVFIPFSGGDLLVQAGTMAGTFGSQITVFFGDGVPVIFDFQGVPPGDQTIVGASASTANLRFRYTNDGGGGIAASVIGTWNFIQV